MLFTFAACSILSLIFAKESPATVPDPSIQELINAGIDLYPLEYINLTFEGMNRASFAYPTEEDNFFIASKSHGTS